MNNVKALVSKKKKRFIDVENNFNLDLSYIGTGQGEPQIIAMGYPAAGVEALYRNSMVDVQRFFEFFHKGNFSVYNLCSERQYDLESYFERCYRYGFEDHNPPPLEMIGLFCASVEKWLVEDPKHIAAVHCKAGKGRTGVMVSCYLVHSGQCHGAEEALALFGKERTKNRKGVTIPSQMRYVHYYEHLLSRGSAVPLTYRISHVRLVTVPLFDNSKLMSGGSHPCFDVSLMWYDASKQECQGKVVYDYKKRVKKVKHFVKSERFCDLDCSSHNLLVTGDVKLQFYDKDRLQSQKMFQVWFHTAFIENNYLCFEKSVIDKACKDTENKRFDAGFKLEIFMEKLDKSLSVDEIAAEEYE